MKTTNLMQPRYEMIADYPNSYINVGCIITELQEHISIGRSISIEGKVIISSVDFKKYPHLFRKLKWWENRDISEMPMYLRHKLMDHILKVEEYFLSDRYVRFKDHSVKHPIIWYDPATLEEYEAFINKSND